MYRIFLGEFGRSTPGVDECILPVLKYAPITSVEVERSFSIYKHMFTDRRHNFLIENFEKHLVVNCFYNCSSTCM